MTPDDLSERLWQFAARVGKVVDALPDTRLAAMWPDNWPNQLLLPNRIAAAAQSHRRPSQFEIFIYQFSLNRASDASAMKNVKWPIMNGKCSCLLTN